MSCYLNNAITIWDQDSNPRLECLKVLESFGADVNVCNQRTLWYPIHWVCYYGDLKTLTFLLEKQARAFQTDYQGFYPIDLAGRKEHKVIVETLVNYMTALMVDYEKWKHFSKRCRTEQR